MCTCVEAGLGVGTAKSYKANAYRKTNNTSFPGNSILLRSPIHRGVCRLALIMVTGGPSPATNTSAPLLAGRMGVQCPLDAFRVCSPYVSSTENAGQLYLPVFQMFLSPDSGLFNVLITCPGATSTYRYDLGVHEEYCSTLV